MTAAELSHAIIESAKEAHRDDQDLPFVQHLEIQARAMCPAGSGWVWETRHTGSGGWGIELTRISDTAPEPEQPNGML